MQKYLQSLVFPGPPQLTLEKKYNIRSYSEKTGNRKYKDFYPIKSNQKRVFSYKKNGANENYFELLDTNRKAYWLGLIAANGWIITEKKNQQGLVLL